LTPAEYGVQATAVIYYGVVNLFLDAGFSMVIIREGDNPVFQRTVRLFVLIVGAVLGTLLAIAAYPISVWYSDPRLINLLLLYGLCIFLSAIPITKEAILSKREQFKVVAQAALTATVVQVILTYVLALLGFSYYSLVLPLLLVPLVKAALFANKVSLRGQARHWRRLPTRATLTRIRSLVSNYTLFRVLAYAASNVDNLLVSKLYSTSELGLYDRAYRFNRLPIVVVTGVISTIQLPMFQRLKDEGESIRREFSDYIQLLGCVGFPAVLLFHLIPYELSEFIWGEYWRDTGKYLYPLSILLPTTLMLNACGNLFIVFRGERYLVYNSVVSAGAQVIGAVIGIGISVKAMIVGIIVGNLLGSLPITMYLGFYRLFGFSLSGILRVWWFNYAAVVLLLLAYLRQDQSFTFSVLTAYSLGSLTYIGRYLKDHYFA
jgi:PST family polysaccharide transporter